MNHHHPQDKLIEDREREGIDIEFSDVSYTVTEWTPGRIFCPVKKRILKNVSGTFWRKQSCAIIGCSGSGKSSLLNFLSGYNTYGYRGNININGQPRNRKLFLKQLSYIMQEDLLQPHLTVLELMEIASKLRSCTIKLEVYHQILIKRILDNLKLSDKENTLSIKLSGGERRRLSIAIELIRNPKVMFFDEPTTGLDVVSANYVVSMLKDLANCGKTIICTIHQASALQLEMFNSLYILSPTGQCIYHGKSSNLINYLSSIGLQCPLHHNPADFVIEVSCGEYGDHNETLVKYIDNGKSNKWSKENYINEPGDQMVNCYSKHTRHKSLSKYINELRILISRTLIISSRDSDFIYLRIYVPLVMSFLFGSVYFNIGKSGLYTRDNVVMLYFSMMTIVYLSAYSMSIKFPMELLLMRLEYFNQWYSLRSYYTCVTLMDLPLQIISTGLFCIVIYLMTGQPIELFRFLMVFLMLIVTGLMSQATGMLIAILFKNFLINTIVISSIILPLTIFAGIMLRIEDTPKVYSWIYDISLLKHSMQGILHAIYGFKRSILPCPEIYCYNGSPESVLKDISMSDNIFWTSIGYITAVFLFLKICTYVVLKYKLS
ncbi:AAA+ ATPase domain,P-loop containing nucleoside triphosphate hydrolase,ABC transporter, conserved site,ABC [Cinara cedri]|uniref:AAA+ ATPase domain,P-loop containing nucleoside triphosphate hydrolase,ABC transporter, conserved site,ABC n=1 Tax=Cinara cedri TaxID=506608 RepID=A0A5E4N428_9HEMI|nr:AAA+ ATPase domain,P-loop containing nucleoside triphosphate hydrolase,ABC transporter, conserved site,ABC [Cinara cedri]